MVMFVGMGEDIWGLRVYFFMDFKVASKILHQITLFDTSNKEQEKLTKTFYRPPSGLSIMTELSKKV